MKMEQCQLILPVWPLLSLSVGFYSLGAQDVKEAAVALGLVGRDFHSITWWKDPPSENLDP